MTNISREYYEKLINGDIDWLLEHTERDLEQDHIIKVLKDSITRIYGEETEEEARNKAIDYNIKHNYTSDFPMSDCANCAYYVENEGCTCSGLGKIKNIGDIKYYPDSWTCSSWKKKD